MSRKKNSEAQNYDFATKKEKYFKSDKGVSPFVLTTQVLGENEWTPALLEMRQKSLLAKLVEIWSLESWGTEEDERDADGRAEEGSAGGSKDKKAVPERYDIRERFWTGLLEVAKEKTALHANVSPGQYNWVGAGSGTRGLGFNYAVREHGTQVELYIDRGKDSDAENQRIFEELVGRREEVEAAFGDTLEWQRLDGRRACRIRYVIDVGGYRDPEKWAEIHEVPADAMARLEKAMKPAIQGLGL
jgi:hypothetical protein